MQGIAGQVIYAEMNTTWRTYIDNNGHVNLQRQEDGCFRCHTSLVRTDTRETLPGARCEYCHYEFPPGQIKEMQEIEESGP